MKIKHLSHNDLDGVGCGVLLQAAFGEKNVNSYYCSYESIEEQVNTFIDDKKFTKYDYLFITDISVKAETAKRLDEIHGEEITVVLLDHHNTANWLNKYDWATVESSIHLADGSVHKSSGTSLVMDWLTDHYFSSVTPFMLDFAEQVRRWDTWEWKTFYNEEFPKSLNDLQSILGKKDFERHMLAKQEEKNLTFAETEQALIDQRAKEIKEYIDKKVKQAKIYPIQEHQVAIVFAENNASELGNELASQFPEADYVMVINIDRSAISFRGVRDDLDLGGVIAARYGGGGHPKAAGATLTIDMPETFINHLFSMI